VLKFYFESIISAFMSKGKDLEPDPDRTSDQWIQIWEAQKHSVPADTELERQHCLLLSRFKYKETIQLNQ
jgi:hypothetical protein